MSESTCEYCGAAVAANSLICPLCGADVGFPSPPAPPPRLHADPAVGRPVPLTCQDPDCAHGGYVPPRRCEDCGAIAATAVPTFDGGPPPAGPPLPGARLRFPWGSADVPAGAVLLIGRENSPLADHLRPYTNVSRRHAEIRSVAGGQLLVVDLSSANGTFVNDERIMPMIPHPAVLGDGLRFGATLQAVVDGLS